MPVGVTTFISAALASGKRFSIGGSLDPRKGLAIGRETDMLVRNVVRKGQRLNSTKKHARAREFFRIMAEHRIKVTDVQVKAIDHALNIRTEIDAIGVDRNHCKVAIELKTTQHTRAKFSDCYYTPCGNQPVLTNQLPNCLYWRHQLQAAFAVLTTDCVRGVVAVMCSDGGLLFEVSKTAISRSLFVGAAALTEKAFAPVLPYPHNADEDLLIQLKRRLKYTQVVRHEPTIVRGPFGDAVLLLVHKGAAYQRSKAATGHRELARALAATHNAACVIGWLEGGRWRFQTAAKRSAV